MSSTTNEFDAWLDSWMEVLQAQKDLDNPGRHELGNGEWIEHRDGGPWADVEAPKKRHHQHEWQTRGFNMGSYLERCACGAASEGDGDWFYIGKDKPRWR